MSPTVCASGGAAARASPEPDAVNAAPSMTAATNERFRASVRKFGVRIMARSTLGSCVGPGSAPPDYTDIDRLLSRLGLEKSGPLIFDTRTVGPDQRGSKPK